MILKLERHQKQDIINRWQCYPYIVMWKWDNRKLSANDIEKDDRYDQVIYEISYYETWDRETKMDFTWITFVTEHENQKTTRTIITTLKSFMMNDDGKTIENM